MRIRYAIALEDHRAYQDAARSAMPGFLGIRCVQSIGGPLLLLLLVWLLTHFELGWWPTLAGMGPAALLGAYLWRASPGLWRRANLDALYREGKLGGHVGEHALGLGEDGVLERSGAGEQLSHWNEIENIYSTAQHTFFVTKTQLAYILPKASVIEGSYDAFVEAAIVNWRKQSG